MKKLLVLTLLLVLPAVLILARSLGDERTATPAAEPGQGRTIAGDGVDSPTEPETSDERAELPERSPVDAGPSGQRFGSWDPAAERTIRGIVVLPAGLTSDPTLRVLALRTAAGAAQLYGENGVLRQLEGTARLDELELSAEELLGHALFAVASVEPDGSFAIPVSGTAWLALDGRYLFSKEPLRVDPQETSNVRLAPSLGAYLTGHVTLPAALHATPAGPLEQTNILREMQVELGPDATQFSLVSSSPMMFTRRTTVDEQGRFAFRAVDPERPYQVLIESEHVANHLADGLLLAAGRERELECAMHAGALVRGTVVNAQGDPVADAEVSARQTAVWGFPGETLAATRSQADGAFELRGVAAGPRLLIAEKQGRLANQPKMLNLMDREERSGVRLVLEDGNSIEGSVRFPDATPAADVVVRVAFDPDALMGINAFNAARGSEGQGRSDEEGRFRIEALGGGPFLVEAFTALDEQSERRFMARRNGVKPNTEISLVLEAPPIVRGRVVDLAGDAVPRFELLANNKGAAFWAAGSSQRQLYESDDGSFVFDRLHDGSWELEVQAPGFGPSAIHEVSLPLPEDATPLVFELAPAAGASGRVVDSAGLAVVGARVTLFVETTRSFAQLTGRLLLPETYSDEEGAFELTGLGAGTQALAADHPDFAPSSPVTIELEPGQRVEDLVLVLRQGGTIIGESHDDSGEPIVGAQVILQNTTDWRAITKRTGADGGFVEERLTPGQWSVTVMNAAEEEPLDAASLAGSFENILENMQFVMVDVKDGQEHRVVLGGKPENPLLVTGRVTHDGEGVSGALISFFPEGSQGFESMKFTQLGEGGGYELELERPGAYLVQIQSFEDGGSTQQNSIEYSVDIPEGQNHQLDLELPLGEISGRVFGPEDEPLAKARVSLTTDGGVAFGTFLGGQFAETTTDAEGRYSFAFVRPGVYSVAAGGALFGGAFGSDTAGGRVVRGELQIGEGQKVGGVDFRLARAGEIEGVVRGDTGAPVGGASIFVRDAEGRAVERFSLTTSSQDGRFRYVGLQPGRYTVSARTAEQASARPASALVEESKATHVELDLTPATILHVRVLDKRGEDVRARVLVTDEAGRQVNGMLAYADLATGFGEGFSASEQRVGPLAPGRYRVSALSDDGRETSKTLELTGQAERTLKLRLR